MLGTGHQSANSQLGNQLANQQGHPQDRANNCWQNLGRRMHLPDHFNANGGELISIITCFGIGMLACQLAYSTNLLTYRNAGLGAIATEIVTIARAVLSSYNALNGGEDIQLQQGPQQGAPEPNAPAVPRLRQIQNWTAQIPARAQATANLALQTIRQNIPVLPLNRDALAPYAAAIAMAFLVETMQGGNYPITQFCATGTAALLAPRVQEVANPLIGGAATLEEDDDGNDDDAPDLGENGEIIYHRARHTQGEEPLIPRNLEGIAHRINNDHPVAHNINPVHFDIIKAMIFSAGLAFLAGVIRDPSPFLFGAMPLFVAGSKAGVEKAYDAASLGKVIIEGMIGIVGDKGRPAHPRVPYVFNFNIAAAVMGALLLPTLFESKIHNMTGLSLMTTDWILTALGAIAGPALQALLVQQTKQIIEDGMRSGNRRIADIVISAVDYALANLPISNENDPSAKNTLLTMAHSALGNARKFVNLKRNNLIKEIGKVGAQAVTHINTGGPEGAKALAMQGIYKTVEFASNAFKTTKSALGTSVTAAATCALNTVKNTLAKNTIECIAVPFLQKLWKLQKGKDEKEYIQAKLNLITKHRLDTEPQNLLKAILQLPQNFLIEGMEINPKLRSIMEAFTSNEKIELTVKEGENCPENQPIYPPMVETAIDPKVKEVADFILEQNRFKRESISGFTKTPDGPLTNKQKIEHQVAITTEILTLKGIYKLFESSGGKAEAFETILEQVIHSSEKLKGDIKNSSKLFIEKLNESMHVVGETNLIARGFIGNVLLPAIASTVVGMGQNGMKRFFTQAKAKIGEQLSSDGNKGAGNIQLLDEFSALFSKVSNAIDAHITGGAMALPSLITKEEFINKVVAGDPKETAKSYKNLTNTFVDTFCPTPLNAAGKLAKTRSELMDKLTGPELFGAKKIFMTPLYAVAIAVMWIVEHVFVRWAEWCINKIVTAFIKKSAEDAKIVESLVTSAVDAITGKNNGGRGTEIMDTLILEVLDLANQAISEELENTALADEIPILSPEENKASKEFVRSFVEAVNKYSTTNEDTLEARIKKLLAPLTALGIGITFDKILDLIAPHIHKLFKDITTEEKLDELTVLGLEALNKTLQRTEDVTKVTKTQLEKRKQKEQTRKIQINNQIDVLSKQLIELTKKAIITDATNTTSRDSNNIHSAIKNKLDAFNKESIQALIDINQAGTPVERQIDIMDKLTENLIAFKEFIFTTASSKSINQDLKNILGDSCAKLTEIVKLFRETEIRLHASIITDEEKRLISRIHELSFDERSSTEGKISEILKGYKALSNEKSPILKIKIMEDLAKINEVIQEKAKNKQVENYYAAAITLLSQTHTKASDESLRKSYMKLVYEYKPKEMSNEVWNNLKQLIKSDNAGFSLRKENMIKDLRIKQKDASSQDVKFSEKVSESIEEVKRNADQYTKNFIEKQEADLPEVKRKTEALYKELGDILNKEIKQKLNIRVGVTEASVGILGLFEPLLIADLSKYLLQVANATPFLAKHAVRHIGLERMDKVLAGMRSKR